MNRDKYFSILQNVLTYIRKWVNLAQILDDIGGFSVEGRLTSTPPRSNEKNLKEMTLLTIFVDYR